MNTTEIPRECKSTVYFDGGQWLMREPSKQEPRYNLAEILTMAWCVRMNKRRDA
jgi:hypothetical protein